MIFFFIIPLLLLTKCSLIMQTTFTLSLAASVFILLVNTTACTLRSDSHDLGKSSSGKFTLSETVPRGDVKDLTTHLSVGVGELIVTGGSEQLLEADFEYSQKSWQSAISLIQKSTEGELTIDQPQLDELDIDFDDDQRNI